MQRNHLPPSSSVPFGDEVLNVGIQLVICVDVYVLEQSGVGVSWGRKTGWGGGGTGPKLHPVISCPVVCLSLLPFF